MPFIDNVPSELINEYKNDAAQCQDSCLKIRLFHQMGVHTIAMIFKIWLENNLFPIHILSKIL